MSLSNSDIDALILTVKLAFTVTVLLLLLCTPLALWLANTKSKLKSAVSAVVSLPLVLPPTVIGFYFLIAMGPEGPIGQLTESIGLGLLPFSFWGLVIASLFYSLPFVVQPLQTSFESIGKRPLEVASTLGAGPLDRFFNVTLPLSKSGFLTAFTLGFTHTIGEFGVVLMIGGNIPNETKVASIQIYDHVEALQYTNAHSLSLIMVVFSFVVLLLLYSLRSAKQSKILGS